MRRKDESLQSKILDLAKEMAFSTGPQSINIRTIAEKAGIATGTVYNYFSGKDEILLALTEEYWRNTLSEIHLSIKSVTFYDQLEEIYEFLSRRISQSAGLLMSSLHNVKSAGQERMDAMQQVLKKSLINRMEQDTEIRQDIWSETFSKEQYAGFILMNMTMLLQMKTLNINFFIEVIKRTLY